MPFSREKGMRIAIQSYKKLKLDIPNSNKSLIGKKKINQRRALIAISEAQVVGRSLATRTERSWQTDRKPIKPKQQE